MDYVSLLNQFWQKQIKFYKETPSQYHYLYPPRFFYKPVLGNLQHPTKWCCTIKLYEYSAQATECTKASAKQDAARLICEQLQAAGLLNGMELRFRSSAFDIFGQNRYDASKSYFFSKTA
uniref:ORF4a n=1 Tax=Bat coronavirus HKU4 TaxID=694007 RepID=A0A6F8IM32_BCHK4|nr:ORF4a [Tylonycteris bat coronavirus HKU4]